MVENRILVTRSSMSPLEEYIVLTGVVSTLVNAWPNRRVIGYAHGEQVRDVCPAFLLAAAWPLSLLALPDAAAIALQALAFAACYLLLSRAFRVEALEYLLSTAREMLASRKGRPEA